VHGRLSHTQTRTSDVIYPQMASSPIGRFLVGNTIAVFKDLRSDVSHHCVMIPPQEEMYMSELDEVKAVVAKRAAAMMAADVDKVASLLDERCIYTHSSGLSDTKQSYIAALKKQEYTYHSVDTVSIDHTIILPGLVIVNSVMKVSMTVKSTGKSVDREIKATELWAKDSKAPEWKLLMSHSTNKS
jgi:ketosteroid isomerase-like protein